MNNRTLLLITTLLICILTILLFLTLRPVFQSQKYSQFLSYNGVRGMATIYKDQPYTLNFQQQNEMIEILNSAIVANNDILTEKIETANFDFLQIYLFNAPGVLIKPIGYEKDELIFSTSAWNPQKNLRTMSNGRLRKLIAETYDH
jgi:hypothetical protein